MMNSFTLLFTLILILFTLQKASASLITFMPLLSVSKKIIILPKSNHDEANIRCKKLHGALLYFSDSDEISKIAREVSLLHPDHEELWVGFRKYPGYSNPLKWTSGGNFYPTSFNISPSFFLDTERQQCGSIHIWRSDNGTRYQLELSDCSKGRKSICQSRIDPYEALAVTSMVLSGIFALLLIGFVSWKIRNRWCHRRVYDAAPQEPKPQ